MWASFRGIEIDSLGANEVKNALEAKTKEAIALVVASMYPDLFGYDHDKGRAFALVTHNNKILSDHITDAIAVAQVYSDQGRLKSLIEQSV